MDSYNLITNYIYLYHIDKFILLPTYPESVQDSLKASFNSVTPLARSAPIYSYASSGPRSMQINLSLHRDMMQGVNVNKSNLILNEFGKIGDDYVDVMIKQLQAIALPKYNTSVKMVDPPMVALRLGNEIFIKGIVDGGITVTYRAPILENDKYANVDIAFQVTEVDPYDAETVAQHGSFRGLNKTLERRIFK